jgi:hypothetical protein
MSRPRRLPALGAASITLQRGSDCSAWSHVALSVESSSLIVTLHREDLAWDSGVLFNGLA